MLVVIDKPTEGSYDIVTPRDHATNFNVSVKCFKSCVELCFLDPTRHTPHSFRIGDCLYYVLNIYTDAIHNHDMDTVLNCPITNEEVFRSIGKLKTDKACGADGIETEFYKHTRGQKASILLILFNKILDTGSFFVEVRLEK
ncbi:hypothetical protein MAR_032981 [Mya arenaria]|uniref:Uncharacterized protein n=1 Tax=Mya arenaria TaxID=6604 RepID=A0ABY7GAG0_MYAAR|nr:hypothetical protein MAR_032981 [Mya arenaria]